MKAFLDTNVLLDLLIATRKEHSASSAILQAVRMGILRGVLTTQSIIDASYIETQIEKKNSDMFKAAIKLIASIVEITSITKADIDRANSSTIHDYEDAAQLSCAINSGCDIIITSDKKYNRYTSIPIYTPRQFVAELFK